jgi:serine/threonine protein kinase
MAQAACTAPRLSVCSSCGQPLTGDSPEPPPTLDPDATAAPPQGPGLSPGTVFAGRYRIVALLGRGGMGEVYQAEDLTLDQPVALKFFPGRLREDAAALARFQREVRLARQISHPNVCRVFDIGQGDDAVFFTMELVGTEDLHGLLRRIKRLAPDKAMEVAAQLSAGLAAAHAAGVLHRDLKPANVMLDAQGNARITDFGLAALAADVGIRSNAGTPVYMAPEQIASGQVSPQSDIYSLGLILFEIFTGKRAIDAGAKVPRQKPRRELEADMSELPPSSRQTLLSCLAPNPGDRPSSAAEVAAVFASENLGAGPALLKSIPIQGLRPSYLSHLIVLTLLVSGLALLAISGVEYRVPHLAHPAARASLSAWLVSLQTFLLTLAITYLVWRSGPGLSGPNPSKNRS